MLNVDNVAPFLLARNLVSASWIIDGDLIIRTAARRNWNLKVEGPEGSGCFLKQAGNPTGEGLGTLRGEEAFSRFCREEPAVAPLQQFIPRLIDLEGTGAVLVYELIAGATTLWDFWKANESPGMAHAACRALGEALGAFHRMFRPIHCEREPRLAWLSDDRPWVLGLDRPRPEMLADLCPANHETLRILQTQGDLGEAIGRLRELWRPDTVIHGDIRFDNILVRASQGADGALSSELWITDWETVRYGDPAWDLAGAFHDFLVRWVFTMPASDALTQEEKIARALVPLDVLRRGSRGLWSGYRQGAELEPEAAGEILSRSVRFSAARLVQSAFEQALGETQLPGRSVMLLQIAANLLAKPDEGQAHLYGILNA